MVSLVGAMAAIAFGAMLHFAGHAKHTQRLSRRRAHVRNLNSMINDAGLHSITTEFDSKTGDGRPG